MTPTLPEEAVKAYIKAFGNTPRTKAMALKNEQKVRHALTAALPFLSALEPSAARELALEEAVRKHLKWFERFICDQDELNSSTPRKVAQNAQDAAAELRAALSSPDHNADAGKVEGDGWSMSPPKFHRYPYFVENISGKWCLCKHHGNGASHTISVHETAREARDAAPSEGAE